MYVGDIVGDNVGDTVYVGADVVGDDVGDDVGVEVNSKLSYTETEPALLIPLMVIDPGEPITTVSPPYMHEDQPNILW
jgi:hypothetical protein